MATFTAVLTVCFFVMACPAKHLPSYQRGGWGKYAA